MAQALWEMTAQQLAATIAVADCSASEALESVLARTAQINPRLNALPIVLTESARRAAQAADRHKACGHPLGPLHGVPVTIKNNQDIAGQSTTEGSQALRDNIAPEDSPVVANLKAAGAIVLGISNTPALSMRWFTDNALHGQTLHPWDERLTPGGSSGGAAVAVASGMGPIAHGNDTAGSVRYPAYACGVFGLRPTPGCIPAYKHTAPGRGISHQLFTVQGPLARCMGDIRLAFAAMRRGSPLDPLWVPAAVSPDNVQRPLRIGVFSHHPQYDAHPHVTRTLHDVAKLFESLGAEVQVTTAPHFEEVTHIFGGLSWNDMRRKGVDAVRRMGDEATRLILDRSLAAAPDWGRDDYLDALSRRLELARAWTLWLDTFDVVVMPVSWEPPFRINEDLGPVARYESMVRAQSPLVATACLGFPCLAVPVGGPAQQSKLQPLGVQLIAQPFQEDWLMRVGEIIEKHLPVQARMQTISA